MVYNLCRALVAHGKLLQSLRISVVTARIHFRFSRHRRYTERSHIVAYKSRLTGRVGDVHVVVEDTHGKRSLSQFAVGHEAVRLEALVLCWAHARKVHAVFRSPVMLLQIPQMISHHNDIRAPFLLQSNQHSHTDRVNASLSHAVEAVASPFKATLHAARVIQLVVVAVVSLLKANHSVHAMLGKRAVILGRERHHLNLDVREILLCNVNRLGEIRSASLCRILSRNEQYILERSQLLYRLILILYLLRSEDSACHRVFAMKTAVDAGVGARVSNIKRNEHRHRLAEAFLGVSS